MPQMTVQELMLYLDHLQRFYGGDLLLWVASSPGALAPLMDAWPVADQSAVSILLVGPGVSAANDYDAPLPFQLGELVAHLLEQDAGDLVEVGDEE